MCDERCPETTGDDVDECLTAMVRRAPDMSSSSGINPSLYATAHRVIHAGAEAPNRGHGDPAGQLLAL